MKAEAAYSYTRDLLERFTGTRPDPDSDGDLPVTIGGARFYARVAGSTRAWVQVFSVAVAQVQESPDLALSLNQINGNLRFARAFWVANQVLIETEIWADDLNPANLEHACVNIAHATDEYAPAIIEHFGGRPLFQESQDAGYRGSWADRGLGFYL